MLTKYESMFEEVLKKMAVSRGKVHKYLDMTLDYTVRGQVQIKMIDFLDEVLISFDSVPRVTGKVTATHM